jgi:hypothetical protein
VLHDGDLCETGPGFGDVPVFGGGRAAEGDDEDREDDPKDVDDITGEDWEPRLRVRSCTDLPEAES